MSVQADLPADRVAEADEDFAWRIKPLTIEQGAHRMKALILAAGLGTRLGRLSADLPKCMLPVAGQPLIERLVHWVHSHGIDEIAINLHHHADKIVAHLGSGERFGVRITYSFEEQLLGTAGAAKRLQSFFDGSFAVIYGDSYTNMDLTRLTNAHALRQTDGTPRVTMALVRVPNPSACGLADVATDGRVTRFVEKPPPSEVFTDLANAGMLVCDTGVLDLIPPAMPSDFGRDVLPLALEKGIPIHGEILRHDEFLIDIGTPLAYRRACEQAAMTDPVSLPTLCASVDPA
jgi:mannose-1-phosphate guanylyltransferase/phosphomannomutase